MPHARQISHLRLIAVVAIVCGCSLWPACASASTDPTLAGSVSDATDLSGTTSVAVSGNYAYTTAYYAGELTAIDIHTDPTHPTIAGHSGASSPALDNNLIGGSTVNIAGGYAFVASKNRNQIADSTPSDCTTGNNDDGTGNALTILDIHTDPANPAILGTLREATPNHLFGAYGVAVSGHYAFIAAQGVLSGQPCAPRTSTGAFVVVDISDPANPTIKASLDNGSLPAPWTNTGALKHADAVAVSGNYAYVTAFYSNRLTVIDISNPLSPTIVASLSDPNLTLNTDVVVSGNYAYVADQTGSSSVHPQLTVVDVSTPTNPRVVGTVKNSLLAGAYRVRKHGNFVYVSASSAATVGVIDVSVPTAPALLATLTDTTDLNKTIGLDADSTGRYVVATSPYASTFTQPPYPPYPLQGGTADSGTISVIDMAPSPVSVVIDSNSEPANPTANTSASFSFSRANTVATMQCQLDGEAFGACTNGTSEQYSSLGAGPHTFTVQVTDADGTTATDSYSWTVTAPENNVAPTISGSTPPAAGQTLLTANPGSWTGSPTFTYHWQRCDQSGQNCAPINGATAPAYTPQPADAGSTLVVVVTATTSAGSTPASSAATSIVTGPPFNTALPGVSGTAAQGQTLSTTGGSWSGYPMPALSYEWERCDQAGQQCTAISHATTSTYTVAAADPGSRLVVLVTATNPSGSVSSASAATAIVTGPPTEVTPPQILGAADQGRTLNALSGAWSGYPTPTFAYQWQRCDPAGQQCGPIPGATGSSYTLKLADVGSTLRFAVVVGNPYGFAAVTSSLTSLVRGGPVISSLRQAAKLWRERRVKHGAHNPNAPLGTRFTFTLNEQARVTLSFTLLHRCPAGAPRTCRRATPAGRLKVDNAKGANALAFAGRIAGRLLAPGRYKLVVTAAADGDTSAPATLRFTIVVP